jgi:hypothetical protein
LIPWSRRLLPKAIPSSFCSLEKLYQLDRVERILPNQPPEGETTDYKRIAGLGGANIWITLDDDSVKDIAAEYREMRGVRNINRNSFG